jgi:hypothetical protein
VAVRFELLSCRHNLNRPAIRFNQQMVVEAEMLASVLLQPTDFPAWMASPLQGVAIEAAKPDMDSHSGFDQATIVIKWV